MPPGRGQQKEEEGQMPEVVVLEKEFINCREIYRSNRDQAFGFGS